MTKNMRQNPQEHEIYKHFKGTIYQIIALAQNSEDEGMTVVYRNLYHPSQVYCRPLTMFMSEVDKNKYPESVAKYRFEKLEEKIAEPKIAEPKIEVCVPDFDDEEEVNPYLLQFLESETYESKLITLSKIKSHINDDMINTIAMSLDIEVESGSLEERIEAVNNCLITLEKYECNRLR
ncbi:MAG: DUF1653 domain-containing protein [Lachnospiraceae bacterium]|nr:DUF1653 domain-containing protein [Lachnospiraceae bacterium]